MKMPRLYANDRPKLHAVGTTTPAHGLGYGGADAVTGDAEPILTAPERELAAMGVCYQYLEPLPPEARHRAMIWLAEVLKIA